MKPEWMLHEEKQARGLAADYKAFLRDSREARRFWNHKRVIILKSGGRLRSCLLRYWRLACF